MPDRVFDRKITQNEFDRLSAPLERDFMSYYKILRDYIMTLTYEDEMTPEEMINSILNTFDESFEEVQKVDKPVQWIKFQGMLIGIENPRGTTRRGKDWATYMHYDYGFIWNTAAMDGDSIDVYLGPNEDSDRVYIIRQVDPDTGVFDEVKVMLGFDSRAEAIVAYRNQYDRPEFFGGVVEYDLNEFKRKVFNAYAKAG